MTFIDAHWGRCDGGLRWGVEPICAVLSEHGLPIAPATYSAARARPRSARSLRDEQLKPVISEVHAANYGVYGVRKMHAALRRDGVAIGRDHTGRLVRGLGLAGVRRDTKRTTRSALTRRRCDRWTWWAASSPRPSRTSCGCVTLTYLRTWVGFAYLASVSTCSPAGSSAGRWPPRTNLPLEALEMALSARSHQVAGLVHRTDAGSQYLAIRYTATLAIVGAVPSVGTVGDSYDNARAASMIGQLKAELIHQRGLWGTVAQLEFALSQYLDWWNHWRLHAEIGTRTPPRRKLPTTLNRHPLAGHAPSKTSFQNERWVDPTLVIAER